MSSVSDLRPCQQTMLNIVSQSDLPPLETDRRPSKSDDEPDPKRVKLDEEVGWDRLGENDYLIYSHFFMNSRDDESVKFFQFLENHVRKSRGFDIDACPPPNNYYNMLFHLVLPPGAPISQELKDFRRIHPTCYDRCLQYVYALATSAVEFQNKEKGSNLEFVKVLKAFTCQSNGRYYYITLVALDKHKGYYRKCQTRMFTSMESIAPMISYGVDSFWLKEKVDAALAETPEVLQSWPSHWKLTRLREDEMPRV